jgi:hypothetical protein
MTPAVSRLCLALLCLALPATAAAQKGATHFVRSDALPQLDIQVSDNFAWLGDITFPVDTVAVARQVVYGIADDGVLVRALIIHFEHFLPGLPNTFEYPPFPTVQLGGKDYLHQTWAFGDLGLFHQPELVALLQKYYLTAGTRWVMDRYVRVVPANPQYEVIIFYLESDLVSDPSITYGGMPVAPPPPPVPPADVAAAVSQRAQEAFTILK